MAHPLGGDVEANIKRALRWLGWLQRHEPGMVIAPWIAGVLAGEDDNDPAQRERGLRTAEETCRRCSGIILCGGRLSSGMERELNIITSMRGSVADLRGLGAEPPPTWSRVVGTPTRYGMREWSTPRTMGGRHS